MQKIDDQWRLYIQSYSELPTEIKDEKNIDEYWFKIYKLTDMAGNFKFTELGNFVLDLMVMPHSNATGERVFSKVNLIKTKIRKKLCTETIDGLILASEYAKDCHSCEINEKTIKLMSHNLYGSSETEDSDENEEIIFENPQST
jgi:hypothetical protein